MSEMQNQRNRNDEIDELERELAGLDSDGDDGTTVDHHEDHEFKKQTSQVEMMVSQFTNKKPVETISVNA